MMGKVPFSLIGISSVFAIYPVRHRSSSPPRHSTISLKGHTRCCRPSARLLIRASRSRLRCGSDKRPEAASRGRQRPAQLNKRSRFLLELKRIPVPLPIPAFVSLSRLKQLAKGCVLRGQAHAKRSKIQRSNSERMRHKPANQHEHSDGLSRAYSPGHRFEF
jgi:hypothetical protein